MPSAPEFRNASGNVRIIKVLQKFEPEHLAKSDCHIRIAAEVEVYLEGIRSAPKPRAEYGHLPRIQGSNLRKYHANGIGQQHLLCQPPDKEHGAVSEFAKGLLSGMQLLLNIRVSYDGACDQLWEHGHIQGKIHKILLRLHILAIYIYNIGKDLEGIERDPDRQR